MGVTESALRSGVERLRVVDWCVTAVRERHIRDGGFADRPGGGFRSDATCWAILALRAADAGPDLVRKARRALAAAQYRDGRVCISAQHRDAYWPTPLAILAWNGSSEYEGCRSRAVQFLLNSCGTQIPDDSGNAVAHDQTLKGWPWVAGTHSWVEPTAYGLMALRVCGLQEHDRAKEAQRLLLNRQLSAGGWNYGNTSVFGRELRPMPETTGLALQALCGLVTRNDVAKTLSYLHAQLPSLCTPLAAAWAALSLSAWQETCSIDYEHLVEIMTRQRERDSCDTVSASMLVLASYCPRGLIDFLQPMTSKGERQLP